MSETNKQNQIDVHYFYFYYILVACGVPIFAFYTDDLSCFLFVEFVVSFNGTKLNQLID